MRVIKFRVWHESLKKMVEVYEIKFTWTTNRSRSYHQETGQSPVLVTEVGLMEGYHEMMQFTGLEDKNRVQIYEGDIVKEGNLICVVVWDESEAAFYLKNGNSLLARPEAEDFKRTLRETEVIGNIYQNIELIKE